MKKSRLDKYEKEVRLGEGTYGVVWKAKGISLINARKKIKKLENMLH